VADEGALLSAKPESAIKFPFTNIAILNLWYLARLQITIDCTLSFKTK